MARPSQNPITLTRGESPKGFLRKRTRRVRSGSGIYLAHNSAKLKIFNLPTSIQLLRFGANLRFALAKPHGFAVARSPVRCQRSAGRWVCSHGSEERCCIDTKTTARFCRAAVFTALRSSSVGLRAPLFICFQVPARPAVRPPGSPRVVETRRLELLTLSLQRRCSAS